MPDYLIHLGVVFVAMWGTAYLRGAGKNLNRWLDERMGTVALVGSVVVLVVAAVAYIRASKVRSPIDDNDDIPNRSK
jgi:hypothetical protein